MPKPASPKPAEFANDQEREYWHTSQDIAFRAGWSLIERDGATLLTSDGTERLVCRPSNPKQIWFETYLVLTAEFPRLARLWVGGRALTKPGEHF